MGVYCSTKSAVEALSEALGIELRPLGIYVTVVEPGPLRTTGPDAQAPLVSARTISDYQETPAASIRTGDRARAGDALDLADAVIELIDGPNPPLRLPFGHDTVEALELRSAETRQLMDVWHCCVEATDFDDEHGR